MTVEEVGNRYLQDGQVLDLRTLGAGLEQVEASRDDALGARDWWAATRVLLEAGGGAVSLGITLGILAENSSGRKTGWIVAGAGVVTVEAGFGTLAIANGRFRRAVESYNATLAGPTAEGAGLLPWAGAVADSRGGSVAAVGVRSGF